MGRHEQERGICELYQEYPERADGLVFGRAAIDRMIEKNRMKAPVPWAFTLILS